MKKDSSQEKELDTSLKRIAKSSLFVFIGVLLAKILNYTYKVIIARYFGTEIYGLFSLTVIISLWFVAFSSLGLAEGNLRFISIYRGKKQYEKIKRIMENLKM